MAYEEVGQGLFAFWKHDCFPYLLGGTITHMNENGCVYTAEYGYGYGFAPVAILPVAAGKELQTRLKKLEAERKAALKTFNQHHDDSLKALLTSARITL